MAKLWQALICTTSAQGLVISLLEKTIVFVDKPCKICDGFSDAQKELLATPSYKIRKDKKAGLLISPKDVTILQPVDNEPTFQSPSGQTAQPSALPSSPPTSAQMASFVTADQLAAISDKWVEQFARMEALLSQGNVFSTSVSAVKPVDTQPLISPTPFLPPATHPTGPVEVPVAVDASVKTKSVDQKEKKKPHKSRKDKHSEKSVKTHPKLASSESKSDKKGSSRSEKNRNRSVSPASKPSSKKQEHSSAPPADTSSGPESAHQSVMFKGDNSQPASGPDKSATGSLFRSTSTVSQPEQDQACTGACAYPPATEADPYEQISEDDMERSVAFSGSDDGQFSDSTETLEQTEDMSYRETVRSIRSYMGWHHIPAFETDYSEPDKSNNPWKGKNPRISVAMPPDDWLCQKLERLNLTVAEGYPSRSQDSAVLKRDQFIKVPKSQEKWYKMHLLKSDGPHRPSRSVFNWRNTEAKDTLQQVHLPDLSPRNLFVYGKGLPGKTVTLLIMQPVLVDAQQNCKIRCLRILPFCVPALTRARHSRMLPML